MPKRFHIAVLFLAAILSCCGINSWASRSKSPSGEQLRQLCARQLNDFEYSKLHATSQRYLRVATAGEDKRSMGYANFYYGAALLYRGNMKASMPYLKKASALGKEIGNDSIMALSLNTLGIYEVSANMNIYVAQRYFLESLAHAKNARMEQFKSAVYGNLAEIALIQQDSTGIKYALNCYNYGKTTRNPRYIYIGANHAASLYHMMKQDDKALKYVLEALQLYHEKHYSDVAHVYLLYAEILTDLNRLPEAKYYARLSIEQAEKNLPPMVPDAYYEYARILSKEGDYNGSNVQLRKGIAASKKVAVYTSIVKLYELMASNYEAMGDISNALKFTRLAKDSSDAINISDKKHMVHERQMMLDMDKAEKEAALSEQRVKSQNRILMALALAVMLLIGLLVVSYTSARRRGRLYKNIVRQNTKAIAKEDELMRRIDILSQWRDDMMARDLQGQDKAGQAAPAAAGTQQAGAEDARQQSHKQQQVDKIYERLIELIEKQHIFTDSQLNRESLAERLGTNRTYLTKIISEKTGMSYPQFINSYRIEEAVRVLSDKSKASYPLKQLCADLGFSSISTFYKLFQEQVGMSPSAYRKSLSKI